MNNSNLSNKIYSNDDNDDYQLIDENEILSQLVQDENQSQIDVNNNNNNTPIQSSISSKQIDIESINELTPIETTFWSPNMSKQRRKIYIHFIKVTILILIYCCTIFTVFWGGAYDTKSHLNQVNIIALIQDDIVIEPNIIPLTNIIPTIIKQQNLSGNWHFYNTTTFQKKFNITMNLDDKIIDLIYQEKYWLALNIKPNVTMSLYNSFQNNNNNQFFNSIDYFQIIYESGRDMTNFNKYLLTIMKQLESNFQIYYLKNYLPNLFQLTNPNDKNSLDSILHSGIMNFNFIDYRPYNDRTTFLAGNVVWILATIFTSFHYVMFTTLRQHLFKLTGNRYKILVRLIVLIFVEFITSLYWSVMIVIFQFNKGQSFPPQRQFMILWMSTWLFMLAVGGIHENVTSIIFSINPAFLVFWVLGFVVINVTSSFFSFALSNKFYKFGYMMPLHNFEAIISVLYLNLSKHQMGRNYGILVAWFGVYLITLPINLRLLEWLAQRRGKKVI